MPGRIEKVTVPEARDKRIKLSIEQKNAIIDIRSNSTMSLREIGKMFSVDKRTIQFICDPTQLDENRARRAERGGSTIYYDRTKNTANARKHREYKRTLVEEGAIVLPPKKPTHPIKETQ